MPTHIAQVRSSPVLVESADHLFQDLQDRPEINKPDRKRIKVRKSSFYGRSSTAKFQASVYAVDWMYLETHRTVETRGKNYPNNMENGRDN